jgi:hypothetical protein
MENNRPKIASLTEKELAQLLIDSFFIIGKELKLSAGETKIFLKEVYKKQGCMYIDTFAEAFSRYAAFELPDAETLRPQVSPRFISNLMKLYFGKCRDKKFITKSVKDTISHLTAKEKYTLFVQFISANKCLPKNPDWVTLYEHITGLKKLAPPENWESLSYTAQWRYAVNAVSEWAYAHFNINEILVFKDTAERGHLKGIGTRLGETLWNDKL